MCTVVIRWTPGLPVLLLALRDELTGRPFDDPDTWWPEQPLAVGGRDRQAGGTWCATDSATGSTALVLNRPQRPVAQPAAPSRGLLPLLALRFGPDWPSQVDLTGMASFAVVLAAPDLLTLWEYDGAELSTASLPEGTHMVTSGGAENGKADRHLAAFAAAEGAEQWRTLVTSSQVRDDPAALLVRHEQDGSTYATVFGQVIQARPGRLSLSYSRTPQAPGWRERSWPTG